MKRTLAFPLLLLTSAAALAGTPIDQTRTVTADATVKIENVKGAVHVTAWDHNQVHVTGNLGEGSKGLEIEQDGKTLTIKVRGPEHKGWFNWHGDSNMEPTTLNVQVPLSVSLSLNVVSADADVRGLSGGTIEANGVSGDIRIEADSPSVTVDTVSSTVTLGGRMSAVSVQTVSGDIVAPQLGEEADLQTVSGDMRLHGGPYSNVALNTVSGDITSTGGMKAGGRYQVDSLSGDVDMQLPGTLSARVRVTTFSGSIHSDYGKVVEKRHGPGSTLDSTVGSGDGRIEIRTFSGDVRLSKND